MPFHHKLNKNVKTFKFILKSTFTLFELGLIKIRMFNNNVDGKTKTPQMFSIAQNALNKMCLNKNVHFA